MSKLNLDREALKTLGPKYLRKVRDNLTPRKGHPGSVRFGLTGEGHFPNYEITFMNSEKLIRLTYRGNGHKRDDRNEQFSDENLSEPFTYEDLEKMLQELR